MKCYGYEIPVHKKEAVKNSLLFMPVFLKEAPLAALERN